VVQLTYYFEFLFIKTISFIVLTQHFNFNEHNIIWLTGNLLS